MTNDRPAEASTRDLVDSAVRRIITGLVIASGVIGLAIYSRPGPPRFQAFAADGRIVRVNTQSGTVIACEENRCMTIVRRGQRLHRSLSESARQESKALSAPAQPTLTVPAPEPKSAPPAPENQASAD